jgi:hypothetical protein
MAAPASPLSPSVQPAAARRLAGLPVAALAGLETGVLGGAALLAWYAVTSLAAGQAAWEVPARLGAACFGSAFWPERLGFEVAAGASVHIVGAGVAGALFGLVARGVTSLRRLFLLGTLFGLAWYYVLDRILLRSAGAGAYPFLFRRPVVAGCALFGLFLVLYPRFLRRIQAGFSPEG